MAIAAAAVALGRPSSACGVLTLLSKRNPKGVFTPLALSSSSSSTSSSKSRKLVLYSKPGCCLCDGLKEKLQAAFSLSVPESLHDVDLQVLSSFFLCVSVFLL